MLQIPLAATRTMQFPASQISTLTSGTITSYYVELRTPIGLDRGLRSRSR